MQKDLTTEEKIKETARKLFMQKGFGLTRSRDIAEEAGINLALLNYYFRSKQNLFEIIMQESLAQLAGSIIDILYKSELNLSQMIDLVINRYLDLLAENPHLPLFVLSQIQANPEKLMKDAGFTQEIIINSRLHNLLQDQLSKSGMDDINPVHIIVNAISMTIFPFVSRPIIQLVFAMDNNNFDTFMSERRILIAKEIKAFIKLEL